MSKELRSSSETIRGIETLVSATPEIAGLQSYEYFRSDAMSQKQPFIDGEIEYLNPFYSRLANDEVLGLAEQTQAALVLAMGSETDDKLSALYKTVEYRYSEMFLISLAAELQKPEDEVEDRLQLLDWFKETSEALYGKPQQRVFNVLAQKEIAPLLTARYDDTEATYIQAELRDLVGKIGDSDYHIYSPSVETISRIQELVTERFEPVIGSIDAERTYDPNDARDVLEAALQSVGGTILGWRALIVPDSNTLAVSAHKKVVEIGEHRKPIEGKYMRGKVLHEIGVHTLRAINAERAGWLSAEYGQDGYLAFEEGAATALEDAYAGEFGESGQSYYLAAGLAYGLDSSRSRDFKEVYEAMWRIQALRRMTNDEGSSLSEDRIQKSKKQVFNIGLQLFRGTTTQDKGVIYLKDLAYFAGQEKAWSFLDGVQTQEGLDLLFCGKLDLTRDDHKRIANDILIKMNREPDEK